MNFFIENISPIFVIIAIFFGFVIALKILRFLYNLIRYLYLTHKYRPKYDKATKKKMNFHSSHDDIKEKNKIAEEQLLEETRRLNNAHQVEIAEESRIVAIAQPKGRWTKFVTQQKMSWLSAMIGTKAESDRFWQNMIEAQGQAHGKNQSRTR